MYWQYNILYVKYVESTQVVHRNMYDNAPSVHTFHGLLAVQREHTVEVVHKWAYPSLDFLVS